MSINYAILGILSYKPMTGYDLKKIIQNSDFMYWSGNNNQIYKALTELLNKGFVKNELKYEEGSPTKKIYEITDGGLTALKEWVSSPVGDSEIKKPFLVHLAWSSMLNSKELNNLIDEYESQVKSQLLMVKNNKEAAKFSPDRTALENTLWTYINDNIQRTYKNELIWIQDLRRDISNIPNENDLAENEETKANNKEKNNSKVLKYDVKSTGKISYLHLTASENKLEREKDILDIITALAENNSQFVLLDFEALSEEFFDPKVGLLASLLQKFTMYHIKAGIVIDNINKLKSEFKASIVESEKNQIIKLVNNVKEAEEWFLSLK